MKKPFILLVILLCWPLQADKKDHTKLIALSAISLTVTSVLIGYLIYRKIHKKEVIPSTETEQCYHCKELRRSNDLASLHCGHRICRACFQSICKSIFQTARDLGTFCPECKEGIEEGNLLDNLGEDELDALEYLLFN